MERKNAEKNEIVKAIGANMLWKAVRLAGRAGEGELQNAAVERLIGQANARGQDGLARRLAVKFSGAGCKTTQPMAEAAMGISLH